MSFLSFLVESYLVFLVPVSRPPAAGHWELSSRRSLDLWGYLFFKLSGTCFLNLGICSWFSSLGVTSGSGWSNFLRLSEDRKWMPVELFLRDPGVKEEKETLPFVQRVTEFGFVYLAWVMEECWRMIFWRWGVLRQTRDTSFDTGFPWVSLLASTKKVATPVPLHMLHSWKSSIDPLFNKSPKGSGKALSQVPLRL